MGAHAAQPRAGRLQARGRAAARGRCGAVAAAPAPWGHGRQNRPDPAGAHLSPRSPLARGKVCVKLLLFIYFFKLFLIPPEDRNRRFSLRDLKIFPLSFPPPPSQLPGGEAGAAVPGALCPGRSAPRRPGPDAPAPAPAAEQVGAEGVQRCGCWVGGCTVPPTRPGLPVSRRRQGGLGWPAPRARRPLSLAAGAGGHGRRAGPKAGAAAGDERTPRTNSLPRLLTDRTAATGQRRAQAPLPAGGSGSAPSSARPRSASGRRAREGTAVARIP